MPARLASWTDFAWVSENPGARRRRLLPASTGSSSISINCTMSAGIGTANTKGAPSRRSYASKTTAIVPAASRIERVFTARERATLARAKSV